MSKNYNIIKFGGSVLGNKNGFDQIIKILNSADNKKFLIVISAFAKVTSKLKTAAKLAEKGDTGKSVEIITGIFQQHSSLLNDIISDENALLEYNEMFNQYKNRLVNIIKSIALTRELSLKTLDMVLSFGEILALNALYIFLLLNKFKSAMVDSTSVIITDSRFGKAQPDEEKTAKNVNNILVPALENHDIVITQGFVAKNSNNEITTMGIESSNLTTVLLAELLGVKNITIFTDVEGCRSADPKYIKQTLAIPHLNYDEAFSASVYGLKLVYPTMIHHARKKNIILRYRSALNPDGDYTVIDHENQVRNKIILIKENLSIIYYQFNSWRAKREIESKFVNMSDDFLNVDTCNASPDSLTLIAENSHAFDFETPNNATKTTYENYTSVTALNVSNKEILNLLPEIDKKIPESDFHIIDHKRASELLRIIVPETLGRPILELIHGKLI